MSNDSCAFYVSPQGNDAWSGRLPEADTAHSDGPFATLERARDAIRALKRAGGLPAGGVTVWVRGGVYERTQSFALEAEDSGMAEAPITYRAFPGERVSLRGGREVKGWTAIKDPAIRTRLDPAARDNVFQADLKAQGITQFGELRPRGFGRPIQPAHLELFYNGQPMTLARWPNEGFVTIAELPADADRFMEHKRMVTRSKTKFYYEGDRPKRWAPSDDIWMHGYWTWDWADSYERIKVLDKENRLIETNEPHGVYGYSKGQRYYFLNILEELDAPGEWYLDRETGMLYFWPVAPLDQSTAVVSLLDEPLITLRDVSYVTLWGFTLECSRGHGVTVSGGEQVTIAGCTLRNLGNWAVIVDGGTGHTVVGCDIYQTGDGGLRLDGGDRKTLTPGRHRVLNNHIHHYGRWCKTYAPAIQIGGVQHVVAHNLVHDAPHAGIIFWGNDHLLEFNELHHLALETGDVGALYIGRDWTMRGNIIRFNYIHHMGGVGMGSMGVYLDDWASGATIYGNVFYQVVRAAFIGSGRDNRVENNIFVECRPAVHVDARGLTWASYYFDGTHNVLFDRLKEMNYREPPYSLRYPELVHILEDEPVLPKGNKVLHNVFQGGTWLHLHDGVPEELLEMRENLIEGDPGFVDPAHENFQLRDDSPAYALGFVRIPMEKIGLQADAYRAAW